MLGIPTQLVLSVFKNEKGKERPDMKKYIAPEMETLSFASEDAITAPLDGSKTFNDGELEW